jgi:hypothetical protein
MSHFLRIAMPRNAGRKSGMKRENLSDRANVQVGYTNPQVDLREACVQRRATSSSTRRSPASIKFFEKTCSDYSAVVM